MGKKSLRKRKFDRTRDDTHQNEQRKEHYWRKKQERANIEERNNDNVNRDFQQEEFQPGMHAHIVYIKSIEFNFKILFNIIDCNYNLIFFKKHK
jgi:hypothetical protein